MVPTSTGAAKAVCLVLPQLNGKLNGILASLKNGNLSKTRTEMLGILERGGETAAGASIDMLTGGGATDEQLDGTD